MARISLSAKPGSRPDIMRLWRHVRFRIMLGVGFPVLVISAMSAAPSVAGIIEVMDKAYSGQHCSNVDVPGLKTIYVQHYTGGGLAGSRLRIQASQ